MAKSPASPKGSKRAEKPAAARPRKPVTPAQAARLTVDTSAMTPEQVAQTAEALLPKRSPRNKVSQKVAKEEKKATKTPAQDKKNVKSAEITGKESYTAETEVSESHRYTDKQLAFVDEYLVDLNATQAAIRAGYSKATANEQACRLLANINIQKLVAQRKAARVQRTEITQDRVLQELARLAFVDIRKAFNQDGSLKPLHELDDETAAAIAGVDVLEMAGGASLSDEGVNHIPLQTKKIKLSEKKGALELLMRHLGMLNDKLKLQGDAENPVQVQTKVVLVPAKQAAQVDTKPLAKDGE